ncbi:MAG: S9 family peptidase [Sphingomonadaceae bacterium]|jgi:oligopeptidase B|nr:MAG: S9 family peptidase [Sphingomonadaceae bacterium]
MKLTMPALLALAGSLATNPAIATESANNEDTSSVSQAAPMTPPVAEKRDHSYTRHGITIEDPYHWLKDQSYPTIDDADVLEHLKAENAWFEAQMEPRKDLVEELFEEMKGRIKEDDSSVPQKDGDWIYWTEFEEGKEYRKWYRKPATGGDASLILNENELAEGKDYFRLGAFSVSDNGRYLAYSTDDNGSERYTARIKDLDSGALLDDAIPETLSGLSWVANDTMLAYGKANENWRVDNVRLHRIGTDAADDVEIYHEEDEGFRVNAGLSAQEDWLIIATGDNETSEVRLVRADDPTGEQILVRERRKGIEYDVDLRTEDGETTLFIHTNDDHINFRLATAPLAAPGEWTTLIEGSDEFYLTDFELYQDFYTTEGRLDGLDQVQVRSYSDPAQVRPIRFPEASYVAGLSNNPEYDVNKLRLSYESMVTPDSVYDYHLDDGRLELLKQQEIPSGYDASLYKTERLTIAARDGTQVPVSVVMRKDRPAGAGPLHLYAYGAYGYAVPPGFSTSRLSLVDRGVAYAIAHIRGGDDLGRRWYLQGKLNERTNTFEDFVDVAKGLIAHGYTEKGKISASGGSAGGELMGVIVNTDPDLWGAVVADVPFVDVLNTMLDESLPLTPGEWPEWGNPVASKQAFAYILSYSPYDQVVAQDYPPMLVTAGLNDPRVTYWEPAKWVAKLRDTKTDDNVLLLKTNMGAGHGGKSGRFTSLYETAEAYAFILWQLGLTDE